MSNLTTFNQDGIEIYIDNTTGESFASISGYSRMSGVSKSTVHNRLKGCSESDLKTAEVLTRSGLQGVRLINEKLIAEWLLKDNPDIAVKLLTLGVRVFLHNLAGYQTVVPKTYSEALMIAALAEAEKERLLEEAKTLIAENEELNQFKEEVNQWDKFIELFDITRNELSDDDYFDGISVYDYLSDYNNTNHEIVNPELWSTISKRASQYHRLLLGENPPKNNRNNNVFKGKKVAFIIATIRLVQSGI